MFKGLGQFASMLRQAKQLSGQFKEMQGNLKAIRATGEAGGGLVTAEANGELKVTRIDIDPDLLVGEIEKTVIEDLVVVAVNKALEGVRGEMMQQIPDMSGLDLGAMFGSDMPDGMTSEVDEGDVSDDDPETPSDETPHTP